MVPRSANKHVFGLIAASAMLAALFFARDHGWQRHGAPVMPDGGVVDAVSVGGPAEVHDLPAAPFSGRIEDAVVANRHVTLRAPTPRQEFETAPDLYAYVQRLDAAVRAGDPDAAWMASRAYDYCAGFAMAPTGYAHDTEAIAAMRLSTSEAMATSRQRVSQRCARFAPQDRLFQAMLVRRIQAARAGSLAAEASLVAMGRPLSNDENYLRSLVLRVRRSKDAEAYLALSPVMGAVANGKPELADQVAGSQQSELAWQVAACELGMSCGPDSALMTSYCANGGICSREQGQDFQRFVNSATRAQGAGAVDEMVASLLGGGRG